MDVEGAIKMSDIIIPIIYFLFMLSIVMFTKYQAVFLAALILSNIIILLASKKNQSWVLFSTALIGSEAVALLNMILYIAFNSDKIKITKIKTSKLTFWWASLIVGISFILALFQSTVWNFMFELLYLTILILTYHFVKNSLAEKQMLYMIKAFIIIEFFITIAISVQINRFRPNDMFYGSMMQAHQFGNWLVLTCFMMLAIIFRQNKQHLLKGILKHAGYILMLIVMLYLSEAKAVILSALVAIVFWAIMSINPNPRRNDLFWMIILSYVGIIIFLKILYLEPVRQFLSEHSNTMKLYVYSSGWNYKLEYFRGTLFDSLKDIRFFTGYGLGQYGSRVSNAFAYNVMWRTDNAINNFISSIFSPSYLPEYVRYVSFYSQKFVSSIGLRSATLSYPFNSFITLIAETGLIGVTFFSYWVNREFKMNRCKILIYYFLIVCISDLYFDNYRSIFAMLLYFANCKPSEEIKTVSPVLVWVKRAFAGVRYKAEGIQHMTVISAGNNNQEL